MLTKRGIVRLAPAVALLWIPLSGCSNHRNLAASAVNFNLAVEQSQNEMLLLNAIRASKRQPMYVSGIQKVTGGITTTLTASLGIPFGGKDAANTSTPGATVSMNPTLEVPVLDTREFMQGFLAGIKPETFILYWDQGWPREFLLHLLVQQVKVRVEKPGGEISDYDFNNYPDVTDENLCQLEKFSRWIDLFLVTKPRFSASTGREDVGPPLSETQFGGIANLLSATQQGLIVKKVGDLYQLQRPASELILTSDARTALRAASIFFKLDLCPGESPALSYGAGQAPEMAEEGLSSIGKRVSVNLVLRSPEAILYYLGEIIRIEEKLERVPQVCIQGKLEPIFVGRRARSECLVGFVTTKHQGEFYVIPPNSDEEVLAPCPTSPEERFHSRMLGCYGGRSMQALSLVNQIIALQKSAQDLPTTSLVRTIGN